MESYKEYKAYCRKYGLPAKTWWEWKKFQWFGDGGSIIWMAYGALALSILLYTAIIGVVIHFVVKYW